MAARSKAAKRASKRGRPKLPANLNTREPNGRPSRRNERTELLEHEMISTVAATRVRHFGIVEGRDDDGKLVRPETLARDARYGYLLGRIRMDGGITENQLAAGNRYATDMSRFYGLTGIPFPSPRSGHLFATKSEEDPSNPTERKYHTQDERSEMARAARARMMELRQLLLSTGDINTGRRVIHTVNAVCVEDLDNLRNLNPPMLAWLKAGLNALAKFYSAGT